MRGGGNEVYAFEGAIVINSDGVVHDADTDAVIALFGAGKGGAYEGPEDVREIGGGDRGCGIIYCDDAGCPAVDGEVDGLFQIIVI